MSQPTQQTVSLGRVTSLDPTGTGDLLVFVGSDTRWEVARNGVVVASHSDPQGWNVGWDGAQIVLLAPFGTVLGGGYVVRFKEPGTPDGGNPTGE